MLIHLSLHEVATTQALACNIIILEAGVECAPPRCLNDAMGLPDRIHIFGASGSGTTTLAAAIAAQFGHTHLDVDRFYWMPTDPPFTTPREVSARRATLAEALDAHPRWVLSGSLCRWGDIFTSRFQLAVFLYVPHELRMARLMARERERYGKLIVPGGAMHTQHLEFIEWARKYDTADESMRSLRLHESWMRLLPCRCIRLDEDLTTEDRIARVLEYTAT